MMYSAARGVPTKTSMIQSLATINVRFRNQNNMYQFLNHLLYFIYSYIFESKGSKTLF